MSKIKLFIDNFLIYGLGSIISNIIPFVMIPIITRLMPSTDYFGISDLSNTVVQFGSAFAIMGDIGFMMQFNFLKFYSSRAPNVRIGFAAQNLGVSFTGFGEEIKIDTLEELYTYLASEYYKKQAKAENLT